MKADLGQWLERATPVAASVSTGRTIPLKRSARVGISVTMLDATLDEASLARFLDAFYARARRDALIGPVFAAAIAGEDWPRHMAIIQAFWSSVLFKTGRYKGNPFSKHLALGQLEPEHFARWLGLFEATASAHFPHETAAVLIERAHRIGESLKAALFFRPSLIHAS